MHREFRCEVAQFLRPWPRFNVLVLLSHAIETSLRTHTFLWTFSCWSKTKHSTRFALLLDGTQEGARNGRLSAFSGRRHWLRSNLYSAFLPQWCNTFQRSSHQSKTALHLSNDYLTCLPSTMHSGLAVSWQTDVSHTESMDVFDRSSKSVQVSENCFCFVFSFPTQKKIGPPEMFWPHMEKQSKPVSLLISIFRTEKSKLDSSDQREMKPRCNFSLSFCLDQLNHQRLTAQIWFHSLVVRSQKTS